jgi:type I restriction enzyme R subunit
MNVVLARQIFSPTDFIQIKGRGTRLHTFKHEATGRTAEKDGFALFDFFANCEFFEEEFDYDLKLFLPKGPKPAVPGGEGGTGGTGGVRPDSYTNTSPDPLKELVSEAVGSDGMRIDREMYRERFAEQARSVPSLQQAVADGDWAGAEALFQQVLADKPEEFWNLSKLRELYRTDRQPTFREILQFVFGLNPAIATREQLAVEHFERFLNSTATDATKTRELRHVFHAFLLDGDQRRLIEAGDFAALRARDAGLFQAVKTIGVDGVKTIATYIRAEVPLEAFAKVA